MSRLTKAVTTTAASLAPNYDQAYLPQHPMLQYKVAHQEKEDHLVNYQEVQQYPAENMFGDMYRNVKENKEKKKKEKEQNKVQKDKE